MNDWNKWRRISPKRARKLRKRGERVKWDSEQYCYVWQMNLVRTK